MMRLTFIALSISLTVIVAACDRQKAAEPSAATQIKIGGPFSLVDMDGKPVTEKALLGKPTAVFFGFTYCPEVCPTTLAELTASLKAIGRDADKLNVVFVSVDPERDTPEQMKLYLSNFDPHIRGFTGSVDAIAATAKAYRVYYKKIPVEGGSYTVDHSAAIYLFDKRGEFVEPLAYGFPHDLMVARLRKLAKDS